MILDVLVTSVQQTHCESSHRLMPAPKWAISATANRLISLVSTGICANPLQYCFVSPELIIWVPRGSSRSFFQRFQTDIEWKSKQAPHSGAPGQNLPRGRNCDISTILTDTGKLTATGQAVVLEACTYLLLLWTARTGSFRLDKWKARIQSQPVC